MKRFEGKVVIVTGAASGIGEATARRFSSEGACVALVDRNETPLADVAKDLPDQSTLAHLADISDSEYDASFVTGANVVVDGGVSASNGQPPLA
jgi:meso-butanediol dehydrogenase / (S,S)-butanediol dehydrogenase / diacetyl reductase